MKKRKTTKWEDFKFWAYLKKLGVIMWYYDFKKALTKIKHCNNGFHSLEKDHTKVTVSGAGYTKGWSRQANFFRCRVCRGLLFPTEKDQRNWISIKKRENKNMDAFVKSMMKDMKKKIKGKEVVV